MIISEDGGMFKIQGNTIILTADDTEVKVYGEYKKK